MTKLSECLSIAREIVERNGYDAIKANLTGAMATALARTGQAHQAVGLVDACMESGTHLRTGQIGALLFSMRVTLRLSFGTGNAERGLSALDACSFHRQDHQEPMADCRMSWFEGRDCSPRRSLATARVAEDLAEMRAICDQYGVVAWDGSRLVAY